MKIKGKKRIRSFDTHIGIIKKNQPIIVCIPVAEIDIKKVEKIGFVLPLNNGDTILPKSIGPITKFNANGKEVPLKHLPKETHYRQQYWTRKEFRGRDTTEEVTGVVDIPYKRYPREFIAPPSIELQVVQDTNGARLIACSESLNIAENEQEIIHKINIFLEIFGECEVRDENLFSIIKSQVKKLNWCVLPKGKRPWNQIKSDLASVTKNLSKSKKGVIHKRFEAINRYEPDFVALGDGGFSGYVVFGFEDKNIYILESTQTNNATYIIEDNWQSISRLTKAEILQHSLHKHRFIHKSSWFSEIGKLLNK